MTVINAILICFVLCWGQSSLAEIDRTADLPGNPNAKQNWVEDRLASIENKVSNTVGASVVMKSPPEASLLVHLARDMQRQLDDTPYTDKDMRTRIPRIDKWRAKNDFRLLSQQFFVWLNNEILYRKRQGFFKGSLADGTRYDLENLTTTFFTDLVDIATSNTSDKSKYLQMAFETFEEESQRVLKSPDYNMAEISGAMSVLASFSLLLMDTYVLGVANLNYLAQGIAVAGSSALLSGRVQQEWSHYHKISEQRRAIEPIIELIQKSGQATTCQALFSRQ